jgi:hypothetical protein
VLSDQNSGQAVMIGIETIIGYNILYFTILYPYVIPTPEDVHALRSLEPKALEEVVTEQ